MNDRVRVEKKDGVADVRMVRADKLNALDTEMFAALIDAGDGLMDDKSLRAVVLSGEGRAFCAGLDFGSFLAMAGGGAQDERPRPNLLQRSAGSPANFAQRAAWVWRELPVPVIAAVHGVAYGGGLQLALAADIRILAPDARLSVREVHWGLVPDMTATQTLKDLVRLDVARELTYTGRIVGAEEAVALGLGTRLSPNAREDALALAREIASKSPSAVRAAKRLLDGAWDAGVEAGLALEERLQRSLIGQPNQVEAVKANAEKREPRFRDPD
jgi:enoyl-CoA hydratase/carnithine racemase